MNRRVAIVTGASGSMGSEAVRSLSADGWHVIMACRNLGKADAIRSRIVAEIPEASIEMKHLDLGSLDSVRSFVAELGQVRVDALFNNAGVINRDFALSGDSLERTMAVNYVGPYLLTRLILPLMEDGSVIVNMVSLTAGLSTLGEDCLKPDASSFHQLRTYGKAKRALALFSVSLAEYISSQGLNVRVNMSDPGVVNSNMISMGRWFDPLADKLFRPLCSSPAKGVAPALRALKSADADRRYFVGRSDKPFPKGFVRDPLRIWLWEETEKITGIL